VISPTAVDGRSELSGARPSPESVRFLGALCTSLILSVPLFFAAAASNSKAVPLASCDFSHGMFYRSKQMYIHIHIP